MLMHFRIQKKTIYQKINGLFSFKDPKLICHSKIILIVLQS